MHGMVLIGRMMVMLMMVKKAALGAEGLWVGTCRVGSVGE